jgi:hypothetical protein
LTRPAGKEGDAMLAKVFAAGDAWWWFATDVAVKATLVL